PQRVTGVSVISNAFTGEVLLDNFQLELAPHASSYTEGAPPRSTRLRYELSQVGSQRAGVRGQHRRGHGRGTRLSSSLIPHPSSLAPEWTLSAWSAPEMPPDGDSYACLAAVEGAGPRQRGSAEHWPLELRLRVDPQRSDANGWAGALEVARAGAAYLRMPIALAPGQPLFWALSCSRGGIWIRSIHQSVHSSRRETEPAAASGVLDLEGLGAWPAPGRR